MSAWEELVTTALLGTGRRALPEGMPPPVAAVAEAQDDPGLAVLDAAAAYGAYRHAGHRPEPCPVPETAPRQDLDPAPERAQEWLATLLRSRDVGLVDAWLSTCVARGLGVRPRLWTALAAAAASPRGPDRALVRSALGERGRAFLALNPAWSEVATGPLAPPQQEARPQQPAPVFFPADGVAP